MAVAPCNGLPVTKKARLERAFSVIRDIPLEIRRDVVLGAYHSRFECRDERVRADPHEARSYWRRLIVWGGGMSSALFMLSSDGFPWIAE
jgi:hypothetical protein